MYRCFVLLSLLLLCFGQACYAGWTSTGPQGGTVEELISHPTNPSILYAATQGGVYKTTDGGLNWTLKNNGLIASRFIVAIAIDPANPDVLFAGHYGGISRSTDEAETWVDKENQTAGFVFAILVQSSQVIYAGTYGGGMYKSTDGGNQWNAINNGLGNQFVVSLTRDAAGNIYAGTYGGGIFKSTNNGGNWFPAKNGLSHPVVDGLVAHPSNPSVLYAGTAWGVNKTTNGGSTWVDLEPHEFEYVEDVAIDPANPQHVYAGRFKTSTNSAYRAISRSTDGGTTWANITNNLPETDVLDILFSGANIFATMIGGGVAKSTNTGSTWTPLNNGISAFVVNTVVTDPANPTTIYSGSWGALHRSTDNGNSWVPKSNGLLNGPTVFSIAVDPSNSNIVYAGISIGVFKSTNKGDSWTKVAPEDFIEQFVTMQIDPQNPAILYGGSKSSGVWKSQNGGSTWIKKVNGIPNHEIRAIVIHPTSPNILYAGTLGGGIFKSNNGADNWNPVNNGIVNKSITTMVIDPVNPQILYAATLAGKVYKTTNGGNSWVRKNEGIRFPSDFFCLAIHPANPNLVYSGVDGGDGIYVTSNGGDTWTYQRGGLPSHREVFALSISPGTEPNRYVHAGTLGNGVFDFSNVCPSISISPAALPSVVSGVPYFQSITATGGTTPYSFQLIAGSLPAGLSLSSSGVISGISTAAPGTYNFTSRATDAEGCTGTQTHTITTGGTVTPLLSDDFENGVMNWTITKGTWQEAGGELSTASPSGAAISSAPLPWSPSGANGCSTCTLEITFRTSGGPFSRTFIQPWYIDRSNRVDIVVNDETNKWILKHRSGGRVVAKQSVSLPIQPGSTYSVRASYFGGSFYLWIDGVLRITLPAGAPLPAGNLTLKVKKTTTAFLQVQIY